MAKGTFLTGPEVRKIRMVIKAKKNKGKIAKELLPIVIKSLKRDIGLSTLQRVMAQVTKYDAQHSYDERLKPWSLGSVSKYLVPPEVIPLLLKYQQECKNTTDPKVELLTIWEAMWVGRLHRLFEHSKAKVFDAAIWYAFYERVWEISPPGDNAPVCDTSPFDDIDGDKIIEKINNYFFGSDDESKDGKPDAPRAQQPFKGGKKQ